MHHVEIEEKLTALSQPDGPLALQYFGAPCRCGFRVRSALGPVVYAMLNREYWRPSKRRGE